MMINFNRSFFCFIQVVHGDSVVFLEQGFQFHKVSRYPVLITHLQMYCLDTPRMQESRDACPFKVVLEGCPKVCR